jgi:hypothetical protein
MTFFIKNKCYSLKRTAASLGENRKMRALNALLFISNVFLLCSAALTATAAPHAPPPAEAAQSLNLSDLPEKLAAHDGAIAQLQKEVAELTKMLAEKTALDLKEVAR